MKVKSIVLIFAVIILAIFYIEIDNMEKVNYSRFEVISIVTKISRYQKELKQNNEENMTVVGDEIKKYIPSITEKDINNFKIIDGELYYLGNNNLEMKICKIKMIKIL
jgi:hypothetical protein